MAIDGQPPDMLRPPAGCPFHPRCPLAFERCRVEVPQLTPAAHGGQRACFADVTALRELAAT
jgi:oligopeptide/dipeptide ABC transporter ATP-binding protein